MKKLRLTASDSRSLKGGLIADFLCTRCGHGHFGAKEPVHCLHCGGVFFEKVDAVRSADEFERILGVMKRIVRDVAAVRQAVYKSHHRQRGKIVNQLGRVGSAVEGIFRRMTEIPNPMGDTRQATDDQVKALTEKRVTG